MASVRIDLGSLGSYGGTAQGNFGLATYSRPLDVPVTKPDPDETQGVAGTAIFGGIIVPKDRHSKLLGEQRYLTFTDIIANIAIVGASIRYFLAMVAKPEWHMEPADDSEEAKKVAEFVEETLYDMSTPWYRIVRRMAMYWFYGFSIHEWTAKIREDGKWGMKDVEVRPQRTIERWDVDLSGTVFGVIQVSPQTGDQIYLPREKLVYLVDDALDDSPEGLGILRHLVEPASRLKVLQDYEVQGYQTDLRGIPIARMPMQEMDEAVKNGKITLPQAQAYKAVMESFASNHFRTVNAGVLLDSRVYRTQDQAGTPGSVRAWDVELLKGEGGGFAEVNVAIQRITADLARLMGTEHMLVGTAGKGALSLDESKTQTFGTVVESVLEAITEGVRADYVRPICELNGIPKEQWPWPSTDSVQFRDPSELSTVLKDLATAGSPLLPGDEAVDVIRAMLGLPEQPEMDEEVMDAALATKFPSLLPPEPVIVAAPGAAGAVRGAQRKPKRIGGRPGKKKAP